MKTGLMQKTRVGIAALFAVGFFGIFYPELCMLDDTCKVIYEDMGGEKQEMDLPKGSELYYKLLSADEEEITIKSRLLEIISAYFEKDKER